MRASVPPRMGQRQPILWWSPDPRAVPWPDTAVAHAPRGGRSAGPAIPGFPGRKDMHPPDAGCRIALHGVTGGTPGREPHERARLRERAGPSIIRGSGSDCLDEREQGPAELRRSKRQGPEPPRTCAHRGAPGAGQVALRVNPLPDTNHRKRLPAGVVRPQPTQRSPRRPRCGAARTPPTRRSRNQASVASLGTRASRPPAKGRAPRPRRLRESGIRESGGGEFFVVLSKTSRVRAFHHTHR